VAICKPLGKPAFVSLLALVAFFSVLLLPELYILLFFATKARRHQEVQKLIVINGFRQIAKPAKADSR
jgi:hypothetical protein